MVMDQVDLPLDGSASVDGAWQIMLRLIRSVVDERGLKQTAFDLDVAPSMLSHCLNERERHNVPAKWIPYFLKVAKDDDLAAFMALQRGLVVKPRKQLTTEQKLERLLAQLGEQFGPDVRALLVDKAFGK